MKMMFFTQSPKKAIEESERAKREALPEHPPMIETLRDYMERKNIPKLESQGDLIMKIGGRNS